MFETLKKRRRSVYWAVPVLRGLLNQLDLAARPQGGSEGGRGHAEQPSWPCSRMTVDPVELPADLRFELFWQGTPVASLERIEAGQTILAERIVVGDASSVAG